MSHFVLPYCAVHCEAHVVVELYFNRDSSGVNLPMIELAMCVGMYVCMYVCITCVR